MKVHVVENLFTFLHPRSAVAVPGASRVAELETRVNARLVEASAPR